MSHNPYDAPQSTDNAKSQPEGFRWRLIPVAIIGGFGAICLLGGVFAIGTMTFMSQVGPQSSAEAAVKSRELAEMVPVTLMGAWFLFAARVGWKGRWKTAIAMSLGLYLLVVTVSFFIGS